MMRAEEVVIDEEHLRIATGRRPRTLRGWWFWFRFWSPIARWWRRARYVYPRRFRVVEKREEE
jgi:hypothetical protein